MNEDLRKMLEAAREASRRLNRCQEADINRLLTTDNPVAPALPPR